jgi:hypothetical protein
MSQLTLDDNNFQSTNNNNYANNGDKCNSHDNYNDEIKNSDNNNNTCRDQESGRRGQGFEAQTRLEPQVCFFFRFFFD